MPLDLHFSTQQRREQEPSIYSSLPRHKAQTHSWLYRPFETRALCHCRHPPIPIPEVSTASKFTWFHLAPIIHVTKLQIRVVHHTFRQATTLPLWLILLLQFCKLFHAVFCRNPHLIWASLLTGKHKTTEMCWQALLDFWLHEKPLIPTVLKQYPRCQPGYLSGAHRFVWGKWKVAKHWDSILQPSAYLTHSKLLSACYSPHSWSRRSFKKSLSSSVLPSFLVAENVTSKTFSPPLLWPNNAPSQHPPLAFNIISNSNKSQLTLKPSSNSCLPTSTPTLLSCSCHINHLTASFPTTCNSLPSLPAPAPTQTHLPQPTIKLLILKEAEKVA